MRGVHHLGSFERLHDTRQKRHVVCLDGDREEGLDGQPMNMFRSWFDKRAKYVAVAKRYLEKQKLLILGEGFQSKRGRFDLIALDRKTLVMVSVRLRGCPEPVPDDDEVADPRDVQVAADEWRERHHHVSIDAYRFDVVRLDWYANRKGEPVIRYFPDAISVGQTRRLVETSSP